MPPSPIVRKRLEDLAKVWAYEDYPERMGAFYAENAKISQYSHLVVDMSKADYTAWLSELQKSCGTFNLTIRDISGDDKITTVVYDSEFTILSDTFPAPGLKAGDRARSLAVIIVDWDDEGKIVGQRQWASMIPDGVKV